MKPEDVLRYSFNQDAHRNPPQSTKIALRDAYYLLVNVEEHPEIIPFAFDYSARQLQGGAEKFVKLASPSDRIGWSEQILSLANPIAERGKEFAYSLLGLPADQARRTVLHFYRQYMPMALVDGCWLQTGARVSTAHTAIGAVITGLYQHQVRAFVSDPGRHFIGDYTAAIARVAGEAEEVSTRTFSERDEFARASSSFGPSNVSLLK